MKNCPSQQFDIIVTANPGKRIAIGDANQDEVPFRPPNVIPEYKVEIIPSDQGMSNHFWTNHLTIGKLQIISGEVNFLQDYIPPCTSILSHPVLTENHRLLKSKINSISKHTILVLRKLRYKESKGTLESNLIEIFNSVSHHLATNVDRFDVQLKFEPPVQTILWFKILFRIIRNEFQKLIDFDREELMQYFSRWISGSELEDEISQLLATEYDHIDIDASLQLIHQLLDKLDLLIEKIAKPGQETMARTKSIPKKEEPKKPKINIIRNPRR